MLKYKTKHMATEAKKEAPALDLDKQATLIFRLSKRNPSPRGVTDKGDASGYYPTQYRVKNPCLVYDQEKKTDRYLRLLKGASSLWMDEQDKDKKMTDAQIRNQLMDVWFFDGELRVDTPVQKNIAQFLMLHDDFSDNQFRISKRPAVFQLQNKTKDASSSLERIKLEQKAVEAAMKAPNDDMKAHCAYLNISLFDSDTNSALEPDAIRIQYVNAARMNPKDFIETFESPTLKIYNEIRILVNAGAIDLSSIKGSAIWSDTKSVISMIPDGQEPSRYLAAFAMSKDGDEFRKLLEKKTAGKK